MAQRFTILSMQHTCADQGGLTDHLLVYEGTTPDDISKEMEIVEARSVIHGIFADLTLAQDIAALLNARSLN